MFCKISVKGSSSGAHQANLMRGVWAVATATAGSTPSVTGTTGHESFGSGAMTNTYEIVTEVLSNTEAGGWEVAHPTSLSVVQNGDGYWTSNAQSACQGLILRTASGKSNMPYVHFFIASMNQNISTAVSEQPCSGVHFGAQWAGNDFTADVVASNATIANNGTGYVFTNSINSTSAMGVSSSYQGVFAQPSSNSTKDYYVACNSEFIHIQCVDDVGGWVHVGKRENQLWEDEFEDNPYWVMMSWNAYDFDFYEASIYTRMREINHQTQASAGPYNYASCVGSYTTPSGETFIGTGWGSTSQFDYRKMTGGVDTDPDAQYCWYPTNINSWTDSDGYTQGVTSFTNNSSSYNLQGPIWCTPWVYDNDANVDLFDLRYGPVSDTTTGALIPPAIPLNIMARNGYNMGGKMKHIYQSLTLMNSADLAAYWSSGATYTIGGQDYIGLSYGKNNAHNCLMMIKKA